MTINLAPPLPTGSSGQPEGTGPGALMPARGQASPPIWPCSARGLAGLRLTPEPVGSYPTISPLPPINEGGMFLCHFPSGHPAWALPSAPPGGARTFLPSPPRAGTGGHPVYWAGFSIALTPASPTEEPQHATDTASQSRSLADDSSKSVLIAVERFVGQAVRTAVLLPPDVPNLKRVEAPL